MYMSRLPRETHPFYIVWKKLLINWATNTKLVEYINALKYLKYTVTIPIIYDNSIPFLTINQGL